MIKFNIFILQKPNQQNDVQDAEPSALIAANAREDAWMHFTSRNLGKKNLQKNAGPGVRVVLCVIFWGQLGGGSWGSLFFLVLSVCLTEVFCFDIFCPLFLFLLTGKNRAVVTTRNHNKRRINSIIIIGRCYL